MGGVVQTIKVAHFRLAYSRQMFVVQTGIMSSTIVLNEMRRLIEVTKPKALDNSLLSIPALTLEPLADCSRYDSLRSSRYVH